LLAAFLSIALLASLDLASDVTAGTTVGHALVEGGCFLVGLLGATLVARRLMLLTRSERSAREEATLLAERLKVTEADAARWREESRELLDGLGVALDRQFQRWLLSPAEREVALLILKGLSHKEIAAVRSISEATARQQARAIYKKSGLSGRNDLAAFFLEDLLLPAGDRAPKASS
jgi:DNA-binding CsgD family transcriptional regulator